MYNGGLAQHINVFFFTRLFVSLKEERNFTQKKRRKKREITIYKNVKLINLVIASYLVLICAALTFGLEEEKNRKKKKLAILLSEYNEINKKLYHGLYILVTFFFGHVYPRRGDPLMSKLNCRGCSLILHHPIFFI
jgi:hypothetical protein